MTPLYVRWAGVRQVVEADGPELENLFVVVGREEYGEVCEEVLRRIFDDDVVDLSGVVQFQPLPAAPAVHRATRGSAQMRFWREFNNGLWQKVKDSVPEDDL